MADDWESFPLASQDPDPDPTLTAPKLYTGYATMFADPADRVRYEAAKAAGKTEQQALAVGDPGIGAPRLGTVSTANSYGLAVPTSYLQQNFGNDPAAWRAARAQFTVGDKTVTVPFVDIGPGKRQQSKGVIADATYPLSKALGGFDFAKANMQLLPNAGPDYLTSQDEWYEEQGRIAKHLGVQQPIGATPAPTPASPQLKSEVQGDWTQFPIAQAP